MDGSIVRTAAAALVGASLSAATLWAIAKSKGSKQAEAKSQEIEGFDKISDWVDRGMTPETLEQNNRTIHFFGEEFEKIRKSFVVVVGLGGVGSHAAIMILRSGVERMRFVDFDIVTQSSLNRHAFARRCDLNKLKSDVMRDYARDICPNAAVEGVNALLDESNIEEILAGKPDYVIDCIDNIDTKANLLAYCLKNGIRCISAGGAGGCCDPSKIRVSDIKDAQGPLTKAVRAKLEKKYGITEGLKVVFSLEKQVAPLLPLDPVKASNPNAFRERKNFRMRIMPVYGCMPAIFGNSIATVVLNDLADRTIQFEPLSRHRDAVHSRITKDLLRREYIFHGLPVPTAYKATAKDIEIMGESAEKAHEKEEAAGSSAPAYDPRDYINHFLVEYLVDEMWRGKSAKDGKTRELTLTRWDINKPFSARNAVLLTKQEATWHENLTDLRDGWSEEDIARIEKILTTIDLPVWIE